MADEKQEAGGFNWDALENDDQFGTNQQTETKVIEVTDDKEDGNEMTEKTEEKKETTATEEKKEEKAEIQGEKKEDLKEEKKEEKSETKEENPEVKEEVAELNLEHLKDYKAEAEDGTWKAVGQMFDVEFENDSISKIIVRKTIFEQNGNKAGRNWENIEIDSVFVLDYKTNKKEIYKNKTLLKSLPMKDIDENTQYIYQVKKQIHPWYLRATVASKSFGNRYAPSLGTYRYEL